MTKQEQLDSMLRRAKYSREELETLSKEIGQLKTEIEREATLEVTQDCAPNHAKEWSGFEQDQLEGKLAQFVYDRARLAGRTTSSIRHRIVETLIPVIGPGKVIGMAKERAKREETAPVTRKEKRRYGGSERRAGVTGFMVFGV